MSDVDLQLRMVLSLDQGEAFELPPCPLYYEVWSFEGDVDVLPRKWCTLINTCFPEREPAFDEQQFVDEDAKSSQLEAHATMRLVRKRLCQGTVSGERSERIHRERSEW